jgi:hypothetical protein
MIHVVGCVTAVILPILRWSPAVLSLAAATARLSAAVERDGHDDEAGGATLELWSRIRASL